MTTTNARLDRANTADSMAHLHSGASNATQKVDFAKNDFTRSFADLFSDLQPSQAMQRSVTPSSRDLVRGSIATLAAIGSLFASPAVAVAVPQETGTTVSLNPAELGRTNAGRSSATVSRHARRHALGRIDPVRAVDDLKRWLHMNDTAVANACGFSRRSLTNWRGGGGTYDAASRRLFAVHALVGNLIQVLGDVRTGLWLGVDDGTGVGRSRQEALNADDGFRKVLTQAAPLLFPELARSVDLLAVDEPSEAEVSSLVASARTRTPVTGGGPTRVRNPR